MRNILFKSFGILTACVVAAGCIQEAFPEGATLTQDQMEKSDNYVDGLIKGLSTSMNSFNTAGFYSAYGYHTDFGIGAIHLMTEFMLNDLATIGSNPYYNRFYSAALNQAQGFEYTQCAYFWENYYTWIKTTNDMIRQLNPGQKEAIGQMKAFRASFYLDLARLYEPKPVRDAYALAKGYSIPNEVLGLTVPIVDENTTEEMAKNNPRAKREDMYKFILSDLDTAEEYLKDMSFNYEVPTLIAVYGLKARAYLEMGYWEDENSALYFRKAAEYARKAIDEGGRSVLTKAQWQDPINGFNNGGANTSWVWGQRTSSENLENIICFTAHISSEATWGYAPLSQIGADKKFYNSISDSDWRKASWLSPEFIKNPNAPEFQNVYKFAGSEEDKNNFINGNKELSIGKAAACENIKFRPAQGECSDYNIGNATDMCLMRIEEMYFIEAEAVAHSDLGKAAALLEEFVHTRDTEYTCSYTNLRSFLIGQLLPQKRIEFWGEGILIYDFKRLDYGIERGYEGTNQAGVYRLNCTGRSPQWNFVISRGETQSNPALADFNNPDPSEKLVLWK